MAQQFDPDAVQRALSEVSDGRKLELLEEAARPFLAGLPDAELTFGPMTRLATDGDFLLDELGIRPDGYESGN